LLPQMIQEELESLKELIELEQKPGKDTIPLEEAAEMTGLKPKSIYSKVSRLEMPSLTRGRPLMFSRKQLSAWMRDGKPTVTEMNYKEYMKKRNKLR
ncbi:MAG: helix-turn-helix domain-containing protein, partial [Bacteroidia bacterium]